MSFGRLQHFREHNVNTSVETHTKEVNFFLNSASGHGCMNDLTTESSFDSQTTRVINVLRLFSRHVIRGSLYK